MKVAMPKDLMVYIHGNCAITCRPRYAWEYVEHGDTITLHRDPVRMKISREEFEANWIRLQTED